MRVQFYSQDAERLLDIISSHSEYTSAVSFEGVENEIEDPNFGGVKEAVNRMGRFAASGESFELHVQFVDAVVARYGRLVALCEQKAISWDSWSSTGDGGGSVTGGPLLVRFRREIEDVAAFAEELVSCREPFRLWGTFDMARDVAEVEAVDLHVGHTIQLDMHPRWMRIYLREAACGNTVAPLVANLQHRFDGALSFQDSELGAAVAQPAI